MSANRAAVGAGGMRAGAPWTLLLLATLLHLGLLALWPVVRVAYAPAFRALAQLAVRVIGPLPAEMEVRFEAGSGGALAVDLVGMDTVVHLGNRQVEGNDATFGASSFFHAYLPTTVLLALFAAAAPRPVRARLKELLWALLLLHLFFVARCLLAVLYAQSKSTLDGRPLLDLGPASQRVLYLAWHFGWEEMLANYLVPLLVFGLCVFGPGSKAGARA
jgi:hypothetical protein